jgi:hypothetical protein
VDRPKFNIIVQNYFKSNPKLIHDKKTEWESFSDLFEKINEIREILFDDTN